MKRLGIIAFALLSSSSLMAGGYARSGCGLGSMLITGHSKTHQVFASTTNSTSGNQTFGITSGTSNCIDSKSKMALIPFVKTNRAQLQNDAAKGSGESLASLNALMGCDSVETLNRNLQQNYETVFGPDQSAEILTDSILDSARNNNELRNSCAIFM